MSWRPLAHAEQPSGGEPVPTAADEIARERELAEALRKMLQAGERSAKGGGLPAFQVSAPEQRSGRAVFAGPLCRRGLLGLIGLST